MTAGQKSSTSSLQQWPLLERVVAILMSDAWRQRPVVFGEWRQLMYVTISRPGSLMTVGCTQWKKNSLKT